MVKAVVFSSLPAPFGCGQWKSIQISHWRPPAFSSQHVAIHGHYLEMQNLTKQKTKKQSKKHLHADQAPVEIWKKPRWSFLLGSTAGPHDPH